MTPLTVHSRVLALALAVLTTMDAAAASAPAPDTNSPAATVAATDALPAFRVTATRVGASETEGVSAVDRYDAQQIADTGAFSVEEFLASLPAEEGGRRIVLVDGQETYLDPNSLPAGMIAAIDVSRDGSMPQYGVFGGERVINIRLKPDYAGLELGGKAVGTFAGGGGQRTARVSGATSRGGLQLRYSAERQESAALAATDRGFSRRQDHRDRGGRDLRIPWGEVPTVVSLSGPILARADHARVLLVPEGATATPGIAEFNAAGPDAESSGRGGRRFDTAAFRWLVSPARRTSFNLGVQHKLGAALTVSAEFSYTGTLGQRLGPPPVSPADEDTRVPAALNPFGQDIAVGLVHTGFGPIRQHERGRRFQGGVRVEARLNEDWGWQVSAGRRWQDARQSALELDPEKLSAALAAAEPSARFQALVDPAVSAVNRLLYPRLASPRDSRDRREDAEFEVELKGRVVDLPAGPLRLALEADVDRETRRKLSTPDLGRPAVETVNRERSRAASLALQLPLAGGRHARTGLRRLDFELGMEEGRSGAIGRERALEAALAWSPSRPLLFRCRIERNIETPPELWVVGSDVLIGEDLTDPRREGDSPFGARAIMRELATTAPETDTRWSAGLVLEPPRVRGLRLGVAWRSRVEKDRFEEDFEPQDILNNEAALPGRVGRAPPTFADLAAGRPGAIKTIDVTPGNTGRRERSELNYELSWRPPENSTGRWRLSLEATQMLTYRHEILPGVAFVTEGDRGRRPVWRGDGLAAWSRGAWTASVRVRHTGAIPAEGTFIGQGAWTTVDLTAGWQTAWSGRADRSKPLKITVGVGNLLDRPPPFADNLSGYRGGSPLGRTWSAAVTSEF